MSIRTNKLWRFLTGQKETIEKQEEQPVRVEKPERGEVRPFEIAPNDPLLAFFLSSPGVVEVDRLDMDSPTLRALKDAGVKITVPLVSQGELIGLLNLGPRLSEQEYSSDDRRLLNNLATQAAPALRLAQLARQQQAEARERERIEQELRVARIIQQTLLPKELPDLPGWGIAAHWQPARAVGGDFYDFVNFPDGRLGIMIADVTDKGVPAAMVMATTRSILRAVAERLISPGQVLERVNNLLCPDIPPNMFVTCLYVLLEPANGRILYANAGHNLPYRCSVRGVEELRATGMPLGLMPEMTYEEKETRLMPGESVLLSSDGLTEAHNPQGEMFSFQRVKEIMSEHSGGPELVEYLLDKLHQFTGQDYDQEDDITLVILEHEFSHQADGKVIAGNPERKILAEFELASEPGNEREATRKVASAVRGLDIPKARLEKLKTAVAEATMNAMEHGNRYQAEIPVRLEVIATGEDLIVRILDQGKGPAQVTSVSPDLEAKLEGTQSPRGWGLFLIKNMVDEMNVSAEGDHHTVELILHLKGEEHGGENI